MAERARTIFSALGKKQITLTCENCVISMRDIKYSINSFQNIKNMDKFYRLNDKVDDEDVYQNIIAMIASSFKRKRTANNHYEITFYILQDEFSGSTRVTYISESQEQELRLQKLYNPVGTIVFMNRISVCNDGLELFNDDEMAVVAMRPNVYQVEQFLKVKFPILVEIHENKIIFSRAFLWHNNRGIIIIVA